MLRRRQHQCVHCACAMLIAAHCHCDVITSSAAVRCASEWGHQRQAPPLEAQATVTAFGKPYWAAWLPAPAGAAAYAPLDAAPAGMPGSHGSSVPKTRCCTTGSLPSTSASYMRSSPEAMSAQPPTAAMSLSIGECSAIRGPFTEHTNEIDSRYRFSRASSSRFRSSSTTDGGGTCMSNSWAEGVPLPPSTATPSSGAPSPRPPTAAAAVAPLAAAGGTAYCEAPNRNGRKQ
mmetsp:Transcript_6381/g.16322  ORF Transcript_6381/g.16322 Transcript_6381/m.16322 type:complete len:232 (-) Transcript_6381:799-1494(-)